MDIFTSEYLSRPSYAGWQAGLRDERFDNRLIVLLLTLVIGDRRVHQNDPK